MRFLVCWLNFPIKLYEILFVLKKLIRSCRLKFIFPVARLERFTMRGSVN